LTILFILNLGIFWDHYFNEVGFPNDFARGYYGKIAFASTLIEQGIFPQWIPFQQMGYPLSLQPQFGLIFNPSFWIFPALGISYTLHNATILQTLHVFAGSVGMFFFLNYVFKSYRYALLGAIAFSFFGGFYSNAPYPDMIRAFAISPWLFYVFTLNIDRPTLCRKVLFIPIVIFVFATGSYPGHFIAGIFMITLFIIFQTLNGFRLSNGKQKSFFIGILLIGLTILGLSISMIYFGPFLQYGDELTRFDENYIPRNQNTFNEYYYQLFLRLVTYDNYRFDAGLYLGLPILVFASFVPLSSLKKYWIFLMLLIIGTLMVLEKSFFYQIMTSIIPPLGFSTRTISEYGAFIAIPIFIFAIIGLKAIVERKVTLKTFLIRTGFIGTWFSFGIFLLFLHDGIWERHGADDVFERLLVTVIVLIVLIFSIVIFSMKLKNFNLSSAKKPLGLSFIALVFFAALILVDGFVTITDNPRWKLYPADTYYEKNDFTLEKNGKLVTYEILEKIPDKRPVRQEFNGTEIIRSEGYFIGNYFIKDYGQMILQDGQDVINNLMYRNFMRHPWTPVLVDFSIDEEPKTIVLPYSINEQETKRYAFYLINDQKTKISFSNNLFTSLGFLSAEETFTTNDSEKIFSEIDPNNESSVTQTRYGINDIDYKVSLDEPKLMVENESYFKGWTATLYFPDHEEKLEAIEVNDKFRGWNLPAGDYEMKANFQFPNFIIYQIISLSAFATCIVTIVVFWRKLERSNIRQLKENP